MHHMSTMSTVMLHSFYIPVIACRLHKKELSCPAGQSVFASKVNYGRTEMVACQRTYWDTFCMVEKLDANYMQRKDFLLKHDSNT